VAVGNVSSALGSGSVALGNNAVAVNPGDVALGSGALTAAANPTSSLVVGGVTYAVAGANPTSVVSVGAPGAERQITNVAAGRITATSTDAVNGSELYATDQAVNALSGNVSSLGNTVTGIGTTVASLGSQVSSNTAGIAALTNGTAGLVQQKGGAPGAGAITVGAQTGGTSVNFTGTSGARVLSGVAAGVAATDAVDLGQLQAALAGFSTNAVQYDSANRNSVTLGGAGATSPVALNNVAAGALTATSTAAVNGAQLYAANANITNLQNGAGGVFQVYQSGAVTPATASALQSTAGGDGAVASGGASTAVGYRASASGVNSVAIGANSSDGGQPNVVSFGTPGNERRLTNVAPGVNGTDAVNLNQLTAVSNYAASLNNALSVRVNGELAGANALSGLPFSTIPTKGMVAAGFGYQDGQGALAVGLSHQFDDRYNTIIRAGGSFGLNNSSEGANVAIGFHF
jgi:autotransporter adhesin